MQHVTSVISSIALNATWVWAPNIEQGAASVGSYWPGNGYLNPHVSVVGNPHVSVVGLDGYLQNSGSTWANTFSQSVRDVTAARTERPGPSHSGTSPLGDGCRQFGCCTPL